MMSGLLVAHAGATNLGGLQAQARALSAHINTLGITEDRLSERYDAEVLALGQDRVDVAQARRALTAANVQSARTEAVLRADAVDAYVSDGSGSLSGSGSLDRSSPASSVAGADASLLRAEYEQNLAGNQADDEDRYLLASKLAHTAEVDLEAEEAAAAAGVKAIADDERQVEATQVTLEALEAQDKGRIAVLIARQQAAERRAQQLAAERRLAAQRAAQQAAQAAARAAAEPPAVAGAQQQLGAAASAAIASGPSSPVAAPSSAAAAAVAAAESRVGDPYVWGAVGPGTFDCSGLVMWSYAQAGVILPHFSGTQYAVTTHISMSDLEPGDLVFFANPDEHVAMYIGNGEVVQAPYTGADVQIVPLYPEFVLATRVS